MKVFIVATNADYTLLLKAKNEMDAIKKANKYYYQEYGEKRNDFTAYDAMDYLKDGDEILPFRAWID